ncbi:hypothetical protein E2C01_035546 [Portunus trituberculatus]|uniref:Uncharacterized protein n=1 Tax=Portunus trituberculatus TaxID=210409 RepID=A0A5B7F8M3_PORTR|nr:hypothetical protein [Portunus trituberculatus]
MQPTADKILMRKIKKTQKKKLKIVKEKEENKGDSVPALGPDENLGFEEKKLPEDETEWLIQTHNILGKRPAEDDEPFPKRKRFITTLLDRTGFVENKDRKEGVVATWLY